MCASSVVAALVAAVSMCLLLDRSHNTSCNDVATIIEVTSGTPVGTLSSVVGMTSADTTRPKVSPAGQCRH